MGACQKITQFVEHINHACAWSDLDPKKIHAELKKQARKIDADYVIGIKYYDNAGYLYGTGTAVKLIKDKSKKDGQILFIQ